MLYKEPIQILLRSPEIGYKYDKSNYENRSSMRSQDVFALDLGLAPDH